ncbi:MAG: FkbM family methyltransferase [Gallionella sp.]
MKKRFKSRLIQHRHEQRLETQRKQAKIASARNVTNAMGSIPIQDDLESISETGGNNALPLARAKTKWLFGEWGELAALDTKALEQHPDRDQLALLIASAHQQLGQHDMAREYTRMALRYGCPHRVVAQILLSGVHNSLGRIAALNKDDQRTRMHFQNAVAVVFGQDDSATISHARSVREMVSLGLLPQAAGLMAEELKQVSKRPTHAAARIKMLETEMELLQQELSQAQQRQQLFHAPSGVSAPISASNVPLWLDALKNKSVSQLGQDLWALEKSGYKRGGFFVEFGATDGVLLSNTWLLEKEFGWHGICAEPNPKFFSALEKNRSCTLVRDCIAGETGRNVEFVLADAFGTMKEYVDSDMHRERRSAYQESGKVLELKTTSLNDLLERCGAPRDIDYISVDTEGSELEILQTFSFERWNVRLFTIEHNFTALRSAIRQLMEKHGYRCTEREWDDWYEKNFEQGRNG